MRESTWRRLRGVNAGYPNEPGGDRCIQWHTKGAGTRSYGAQTFVKRKNNGFLATSGGGDSVSQRQRRFADARGTEEQDIGPTIEAAAFRTDSNPGSRSWGILHGPRSR
jgi:hypothetical protein